MFVKKKLCTRDRYRFILKKEKKKSKDKKHAIQKYNQQDRQWKIHEGLF